jgi:hypothetical protein
MENLTVLAMAAAKLLFEEAVKETGKGFGKTVTEKIGQLGQLIREKLHTAGTEGLLIRAERQPTEKNVELVRTEIETHLDEDPQFAIQLRQLFNEIRQAGFSEQDMLTGIELEGDLEAEELIQRSISGGEVHQQMLSAVKAKNIKIGRAEQES